MNRLPNEIWYDIFKYLDIKNLSILTQLSKFYCNKFIQNKWSLIDIMHNTKSYIPLTKETYLNYFYTIDFDSIIIGKRHIPNNVIHYMCDVENLHSELKSICIYQTISDDNLLKRIYKIVEWKILLKYQCLPIDILYDIIANNNISNIDWHNIWSKQKLTFDFILANENNIEWHALSSNKDSISFDLVKKFHDKLIWQEITKHGIHEQIICQFIHKMDFFCWMNISQFTELSEQFIKLYIDKLQPSTIIRFQNLSENYLLELKRIYFDLEIEEGDVSLFYQLISLHQKLSRDFIKYHKNMLYLRMMIRNKKIARQDLHIVYDTHSIS